MKWVALLFALALNSPLPAAADTGELQLAVMPATNLLVRHANPYATLGGRLRASYGLLDSLDFEVHASCDYVIDIGQDGAMLAGRVGTLEYDALRCGFVPALALRLGERLVGSAAFGLGYRFEMHFSRELLQNDLQLEMPEDKIVHQMIGYTRLAGEYRLTDFVSAGVFVDFTLVMVGGQPELDMGAGLVLAGYFYP